MNWRTKQCKWQDPREDGTLYASEAVTFEHSISAAGEDSSSVTGSLMFTGPDGTIRSLSSVGQNGIGDLTLHMSDASSARLANGPSVEAGL